MKQKNNNQNDEPFARIYTEKKKINLDGTVFDAEAIEVTGKTLKECKKIYDKIKEEEKEC